MVERLGAVIDRLTPNEVVVLPRNRRESYVWAMLVVTVEPGTWQNQPGVDKAADAGWHILVWRYSSRNVVAVQIMEDDPQLNGAGGRKRAGGSVQLDAAIATSDGRLGCIMAIEVL